MTQTEEARLVLEAQFDDVVRGLLQIVTMGDKVVGIFDKVGNVIDDAFNGVGKGVSEIQRMGQAVGNVLGGISKDIADIDKAIRQADMGEWERQADSYAQRIEEARASITQLEQQLKKTKATDEERLRVQQQILQAQKQIVALEQAQGKALNLAKLAADAKLVQDGMAQIDTVIDSIAKRSAEIGRAVRQFGMTDMAKQQDDYNQALEQSKTEIRQLETYLKSLAATSEERLVIETKIKQAYRDIGDLAGQQAAHMTKLQQAEEAALSKRVGSEAKEGLQELGMTAGIASAALTVGLGSALNSYGQLEGKVRTFGAVSKASNQDMADFRQTAYSLTVLGKSSEEIAGLGVELSKAGLSADQVKASLGTMVQASVGTGESLDGVGEVIDNVRTNFGLAVDEIDRVANGVVYTANATKVSVADIGESYKYLGSSAAQANQPLEDVNAILKLLGDNGIKASQAGNGMQNAYLKMTDPKVRAALKGINVEVTDGHGRLRQMTDILKDLKKGLDGFADVDKAAFLEKQFGDVALVPMLTLLGKTDEQINQTRESMENWQGTIDDLTQRMSQGLAFNLNQASISWDTFKKQFGESLEPILSPLLAIGTTILQAFGKLPGPLRTFIAAGTVATTMALGLAAGIASVSFFGGGMLLSLGKVANGLLIYAGKTPIATGANLTVAGSFTAIKTAASNLPGVIAKFALSSVTSLGSVAAAGWGAMAPWLPLIAIAAALYAAWELNLGGMRDAIMVAFEAARMTFDDALAFYNEWLASLGTNWQQVWDGIMQVVFFAIGYLDNNLRVFGQILGTAFSLIFDFLTGNWGQAWRTIGEIMESATGEIQKALGNWIDKFGRIFRIGMNGLGEMAAGLWDLIANPGDPSGAFDRISAGFNSLGEAAKLGAETAQGAWDSVFDAMLAKVTETTANGKKLWDNSSFAKNLDAVRAKLQQKTATPAAKADPTRDGLIKDKDKKGNGETEAERIIRLSKEQMKQEIAKEEEDYYKGLHRTGAEVEKTMGNVREQIASTAKQWVTSGDALKHAQAKATRAMVELGGSCGYTVDHLFDLSKATVDFTKVVSNPNVAAKWMELIGKGYATLEKTAQAGDIILNQGKTHIGMAVGDGKVVHAGGGKGMAVRGPGGVTQLGAIDNLNAVFGNRPIILRLTDKAFKAGISPAASPTTAPVPGVAKATSASESFIKALKKEEGFQAKAYWDAPGKAVGSTPDGWAVGHGNHNMFGINGVKQVQKGTTIDEATADKVLRRYLEDGEKAIMALGREFNQNQFDALMGFVYNAGVGVFGAGKGKRIADALKKRDDATAMKILATYTSNDPKYRAQLAARRQREIALFNKAPSPGSGTIMEGGKVKQGSDEDIKKEQIRLEALAHHMQRIEQAQAKFQVNGEEWKKLEKEKQAIISENSEHRAALEKARAKAREDQQKNEKEAEKQLGDLQAKNFERQINRMPVLDKLLLGKEAALAELDRKHEEDRSKFKGNYDQFMKLQRLQNWERVLLEQDSDEQIRKGTEDLYAEMAQIRAGYVDTDIEQQKKAVDEKLRLEIRGLEEQQKKWDLASTEYWELEQFKTDATERAAAARRKIEIDNQVAIAEAMKENIRAGLKDTETAFLDSFQGFIQSHMAKGLQGGSLFDALAKPENMQGLAEALQGGSIETSLESLYKLVEQARREKVGAEKSLAELKQTNTYDPESKEAIDAETRVKVAKKNFEIQFETLTTLEAMGEEGRGLLQTWANMQPEIQKSTEEMQGFQAVAQGIGDTLSSLANAFGETGRNIGAGINFVTGLVTSTQKLINDLGPKMKLWSAAANLGNKGGEQKGWDLEKLMKSPDDIQSIVGLLTAAASIWADTVNKVLTMPGQFKQAAQRMLDAERNAATESALATEREKLEIRKAAGQNVLSEEIALIDKEADYRIEKARQALQQAKDATGSGMFGLWTMEDYERLQQAQLNAQKENEEAERQRRQQKEAATKAQAEREVQLIKENAQRIEDAAVLAAQTRGDKMAEAEAQALKQRGDIDRAYADNLVKLIVAGADPAALQNLLNLYNAQVLNNEVELARKKREIQSQEQMDLIKAQYEHETAVANLAEDGFAKEVDLMRIAKRQKDAELEAEQLKYTAYTIEWNRLAQQRADAEIEAENRIKKAIEENARLRTRTLADLRNEIARLQADATVDTADDVPISYQISLTSLANQEEDDVRKARADFSTDYEGLQKALTDIAEKYSLLRGQAERNAQKSALDAVRADYERAEREKLDKLKAPIEATIRAEERKLAKLEKQTAEYQKQIDLIDERTQKELDAFDKRDKTEFNAKKAKVDLNAGLTAGIDYLANTNIKGEVLDRSSRATQLRGLQELLKKQEQDAKSALDLEEISKAQYNAEIERILLLRSAALEAAMAEAKSEQEKSDLKKELSEQYVAYQELERQAIEEVRAADKRQYEEKIRQTNSKIEVVKSAINEEKAKLDELQLAYDEKMALINAQLIGATTLQGAYLDKIKAMAPAFAESAKKVINDINRIKTTYLEALEATGNAVPTSGSKPVYDATKYYNDDGSKLSKSQIPSRDKAMTDQHGNFSVAGSDGRYYRTSSEAREATRKYDEGGLIPDIPEFRNDRLQVAVGAGEWILNRRQSKRLNGMLDFHESAARARYPVAGGAGGDVYIGDIYVSSNVDAVNTERLLDGYMGARERRTFKRMGANGLKRT